MARETAGVPPQAGFGSEIEVRLLTAEVTVDGSKTALLGLADLEVRENGELRTVVAVDSLPSWGTAGSVTVDETVRPAPVGDRSAHPQTLIWAFDLASLTPWEIRTAAGKLRGMTSQATAGTHFTVALLGHELGIVQGYTADRAAVEAALDSLAESRDERLRIAAMPSVLGDFDSAVFSAMPGSVDSGLSDDARRSVAELREANLGAMAALVERDRLRRLEHLLAQTAGQLISLVWSHATLPGSKRLTIFHGGRAVTPWADQSRNRHTDAPLQLARIDRLWTQVAAEVAAAGIVVDSVDLRGLAPRGPDVRAKRHTADGDGLPPAPDFQAIEITAMHTGGRSTKTNDAGAGLREVSAGDRYRVTWVSAASGDGPIELEIRHRSGVILRAPARLAHGDRETRLRHQLAVAGLTGVASGDLSLEASVQLASTEAATSFPIHLSLALPPDLVATTSVTATLWVGTYEKSGRLLDLAKQPVSLQSTDGQGRLRARLPKFANATLHVIGVELGDGRIGLTRVLL